MPAQVETVKNEAAHKEDKGQRHQPKNLPSGCQQN